MAGNADLEIGLTRWDADHYRVELRFSWPEGDVDLRPAAKDPSLAHFDFAQLRALELDPTGYGKLLGQSLFADEALRTAFAQARSNARSGDATLRLRLFIDPSVPELHALRWETLCDPADGASLVTSERLLFSRYLSSQDWQRVKLRPLSGLRMLVCVASPANLAQYQLVPVDTAAELARIRAALGAITTTELAAPGKATLANLSATLRDDYDILYLVCHGALIDGEPRLYLEDEQGQVAVVNGADLVTRVNELEQTPRLAVLASCQSAEMRIDDGGALTALGPRLAQAGVSAVVAMQGSISMQTSAAFMPVLFKELRRDGQIDRALAVARGAVRERPDSWMPALFTRLKSGRIWYVPGFAVALGGFDKWPAVISALRRQIPGHAEIGAPCTPILGPGFSEGVLGPRRDIATHWADQFHFPLAPYNRENLSEVAQYLAVNQALTFPHQHFGDYLAEELWQRYQSILPAELKGKSASQLMAEVGRQHRQQNPADPYQVLANLPLSVYIATNPDNLLPEALKAAGKDPQVELCRWNDAMTTRSIYDDPHNQGYYPTVTRPLVYCLLGQLDDLDSLVLTEDDYFDYLIGLMKNRDLIPKIIGEKLTNTTLLFLGFQLDDWTFRVPFRYILSQDGGVLLEKYPHVAAQIDPEEGLILEPEGARRYLESYFQKKQINIYWGTSEDFARELLAQWQKGGAA